MPRACEKELREFQVALVARHFEQLDQGQFDFFMARHVDPLSRAEPVVDVVGVPDGHIQQRAFLRGAVVSDGRFDQVSGTIHFVFHAALGPLLARFHQRVVGVEVAVFPLRGGDLGNDFVGHAVQLGSG